MAWTIDDMPDQTGRVAVVTGANGGLGLESAKALAGAGAHVVMAARNQQKAAAAMEEILRQHPQASLEIVGLDLGSFESTKTAAATIAAAHPVVDILINNAGLMALPERRTVDGYEMQLGVNHLGHWIFTAGLLASLAAADSARVVTVTSVARLSGNPVDPENVNMEDTYDAWGAYGRSKLANFHFALGLQRQFERHGLAVESLSAHPGLSNTDLQSNTVEQGGGGSGGTVSHWMANRLGMSADDGARSQLRAATDPTARGGELYGPRWGMSGAPVRKSIRRRNIDRDVATLWEVSERETGVRFEFEAGSGDEMSIDRPAAIRRALRDLVAERGFHGASMSAVAKAAGVAAGTAYVHYESKDELVYATYLEIKEGLVDAVMNGFDGTAPPYERWRHMLTAAYRHLAAESERAKFLSQLDESPYYEEAHRRHIERGDAMTEALGHMTELVIDLPPEVIYALTLGVAVRLVAAGTSLKDEQLELLVDATWRAVVKP